MDHGMKTAGGFLSAKSIGLIQTKSDRFAFGLACEYDQLG